MKRLLLSLPLLALLLTPLSIATAESLDTLLQRLHIEESEERRIINERLEQFRSETQKQQALRKEVAGAVRKAEQHSHQLERNFQAGEKELSAARAKLDALAANYQEVFATAKLWASDLRQQFLQSLINAQYPARSATLKPLADEAHAITIEDLNRLLFEALNEAHEQSRVVQFQTPVITGTGGVTEAIVTRIGPFTATVEGNFLTFSEATQQLRVLPRQPRSSLQSIAEDFADTDQAMEEAVIDPSRGAILALRVDAPGLRERIHQGGPIGYLIILLGLFGIAFACLRGWQLHSEYHRIQQQRLRLAEPRSDNALGRIALIYRKHFKDMDADALEDRIHEAISEELPAFIRGLNLLRVLAVIAPLLGLLGTVTGMIQTFQDITLFGTGDPRMMAGGISQALVTTALGLSAAVPVLLLLTLSRAYSIRLRQIVEEQSLGLLARAHHHQI